MTDSRNYKPELVRINLSTPIIMKNRCRKCGKHPDVYYYLEQPTYYHDPRASAEILQWLKLLLDRMSADWYQVSPPSEFTGMSLFAHQVNYKGHNPRLSRSRGLNASSNVVEYLTCECGYSNWTWADRTNQNRPEIVNRRARSTYPKRFLY